MSTITSFEARLTMEIPRVDNVVQVIVKSDVHDGMTIEIPPGVPMYELHDQILNGLISGISFYTTPSKKEK